MAGLRHWVLCVLACASSLVQANTGLWALPDQFVDDSGVRASLMHWSAALTVVSMEYSDCKFVCSTNWKRLQDIQIEADRQNIPVRFLIVSLDPANDSPSAWRDYRKSRGLTRSNWSFVTGSRSATDKVVAALNVKWWYFNDFIMHDFRIVRLNAEGQQLAVMRTFDEPASAFLSAAPKAYAK